jgi:hypothetical protein
MSRASQVGQCILIVLGLAWAAFERPAPVINVSWREDVSDAARQQVERELFLERGEEAGDTWRYELGWPSRANIAALVQHPSIRDTHHVDRAAARLSDDVAFGTSKIWWAGPLRGERGRRQFRYLFGAIGIATLLCAWLARRSAS